MYKQTSFLITGAILVAAIVTVALYNVNVANAQANMTAGPIRSAISNATK